jgi:hypothetical protein
VDLPLVIPLVGHGELVARRRLPRAANHIAVDPGIIDSGRAVVLEGVRDLDVRRLVARRAEPPQLVLDQRPAGGAVEIVEVLDARTRWQTARSQSIVEVRRLQVPIVGGAAEKPEPCSALPPSFGIRLRRTPPADDSADTPLV